MSLSNISQFKIISPDAPDASQLWPVSDGSGLSYFSEETNESKLTMCYQTALSYT